MAFYGKYLTCVIVLFSFGCIYGQTTCGKLNTNGYTVPHGDIILQYGEDLNIICNLNKILLDTYGKNASSRMFFTRNNYSVSRNMIDIINSTSIRLHITKPPKVTGDNYYCQFEDNDKQNEVLCLNVVVVGVPPQNVNDFSCISRNYDNLTCTWTPPENYVRTSYNLKYYLRKRASRFNYSCPKLETLDNGQMSCFWNVSTNPQYRQSHNMFFFGLEMNNTFGTNMNEFTFEHFKHVLPNAPENLTAKATSPHSIHLSWVIPSSMINFSPGLHHRVLYHCEYNEEGWQLGGLITEQKKDRTLEFELTGLKYAYALCDIRVSMRSAMADVNDESLWSDNATRTERTLSDIPDCPPRTNIGSFEIINAAHSRNAFVYWQQLRQDQKNGQNFSYHVEVENYPNLKPMDVTNAYAMFTDLSAKNYVINIWSQNENGRSRNKSTVIIPSKRLSEPQDFVKVAHNDNLYELSWKPPSDNKTEIVSYTVFWCSNNYDRPYQCEGNLNWEEVSSTTFKYNQTLKNNIYQTAISANSKNSSSGLFWSECTVIPNAIRGVMKSVTKIHVDSTYIELGWNLECSNRIGTIKGYIIYYCLIVQEDICNATNQNVTINGDVGVKSGNITGLKPNTLYQISVSYVTDQKTYSQPSEPFKIRTLEDAPSTPPLHFEVFNVTNTTISLRWLPPTDTNGVLKYYNIEYSNTTNTFKKVVDSEQNETTLSDLMSYVKYSIRVQACTISCSNYTTSKIVQTKVGEPGEIKRPMVRFQNDTLLVINWDEPSPPRGKIDHYQVHVMKEQNVKNLTVRPYNVTSKNFSIQDCSNSGSYQIFYVSVRAVNKVDDKYIAGPWSESLKHECTSSYRSWVYILVGVSIIFTVLLMSCFFKRFYVYCKKMQDVQIKLPPGLHPVIEVSGGTEDELFPTKPPKNIERGDEELLLVKMPGSNESTSSGHASITSSLESGTHLTGSDSGTEQPRTPVTDDGISIRQRNISANRPPKGYIKPDAIPNLNWPSKTTPPAAGNYCVLGVEQPTQDDADTPISDLNTKLQLPYNISTDALSYQPPPYVMTGDFIKTPNPGYVSAAPPQVAEKNTGYVVAGLTGLPKDELVPDLLMYDTHKPTSLEEKPLYVKAAETLSNLKDVQFPWQQQQQQQQQCSTETTLPKTGYVSVGDALPPKTVTDVVSKGYLPHRQFEAKSLKED